MSEGSKFHGAIEIDDTFREPYRFDSKHVLRATHDSIREPVRDFRSDVGIVGSVLELDHDLKRIRRFACQLRRRPGS